MGVFPRSFSPGVVGPRRSCFLVPAAVVGIERCIDYVANRFGRGGLIIRGRVERVSAAGIVHFGIPSQSPTYGFPMLSSFPFGVHSPEKSICANAGTRANVIRAKTKTAAIP